MSSLQLTPRQSAMLLLLASMRVKGSMRTAGDVPGHEFHGNQWTSGPGGDSPKASIVEDALEEARDQLSSSNGVYVAQMSYSVTRMSISDIKLRERKRAIPALIEAYKNKPESVTPPSVQHGYGGSKPIVLDGHHRIASAKAAGLKSIWVVQVHHTTSLTDEESYHPFDPEGYKHHVFRELRGAASRVPSLHRIADAHYQPFLLAISTALLRGKSAAKTHSVETIVSAVRSSLKGTLTPVILSTIAAGGAFSARMLNSRKRIRHAAAKEPRSVGPIEFSFNVTNEHVVDWADRHAAELIDHITETTREVINNAVAAHAENSDWSEYYDEILSAVGDTSRADLIARHESMLAANEGQRQSWDQAVENGLLTGEEQRAWILTEDGKTCEICEGLADTKAPLDGAYEFDGEEYDGPPAHVRCRCTEGIAA